MSIKCKMGIHSWDGCICTACGKTRNEQHDLSKDCGICAKCGKTLENHHNWQKDCEICSVCGKTREGAHHWLKNCEKCSVCGHTRHGFHQISDGICVVCGHGEFADSDGKTYKVIKIGDQVLMADSYAKIPTEGNFWAYEDKVKHNYQYDWETAMKIAPKGWHLPSKEEFEELYRTLGGHSKEVFNMMKTDGQSGFDAVFSGWRSVKGVYNGLSASAHFWTSTKEDENHVWQFELSAVKHHANFEKAEKDMGLSIRFFKDK